MSTAEKSADHLLRGAPPMATKVGFWRRRSALRWGKRSAAVMAPDLEGHHPATRAMAAEVAQLEARIHNSLVRAVEELDRMIAPSETHIRILAAEVSKALPPETSEVQSFMTAAEQDVVRTRAQTSQRRSAHTRASREQLSRLQLQVAELSQQREHLHSTAAGILDSWIAHFDKLVAHHREGFLKALTRRFPAPVLTIQDPGNLPLPRYQPTHLWAEGRQLPVTITEISPTQQPTLRWSHLPWDT